MCPSLHLGFHSVSIKADAVTFKRSTLRLLAHSMDIEAAKVAFLDTRFNEPKQLALASIRGFDATSTLTVVNVYLRDPSRGTLLTPMPNVRFDNVTVSLCPNGGDLVDDLLSDVNKVGFRANFIPASDVQLLHEALENVTFCYTDDDILIPASAVAMYSPQGGSNPGSSFGLTGIVITVFLAGVVLILTFMGVFVYKWHRVLKMRYKILRGNRMMQLVTKEQENSHKHYREQQVSFNLEQVQYISRPPSVFYIDSNAAPGSCPDLPQVVPNDQNNDNDFEALERRTLGMIRELDEVQVATRGDEGKFVSVCLDNDKDDKSCEEEDADSGSANSFIIVP